MLHLFYRLVFKNGIVYPRLSPASSQNDTEEKFGSMLPLESLEIAVLVKQAEK